jgi:hypothetical protein
VPDQVVPREVRGVVERPRRGVTAREPERRRMRTDRAERAARAEVERPEAAHRDTADCDARRMRSSHAGRDRLVQHHRAPAAVAPVVPVAVVTAVEEEDGRCA